MKLAIRGSRLAIGLVGAAFLGISLGGCSQTTAPEPNLIQRVEGTAPAAPPPSGFLGSDYSLLAAPAADSGQKAMLVYTNPTANFSQYNKIMIAPVTFWGGDDTKVSAADQQALCDYFFNVLHKDLSKNFVIVDQPGPGVVKFSAALTDASSAVPVLRTISIVVPQARALSTIKMAATGTYAFVGSAEGEAKLTDSVTGQLLAAWADKRVGGVSLKNADVFTWGDADNAMDYWANGLDQRLMTLGVQHTAATAAN